MRRFAIAGNRPEHLALAVRIERNDTRNLFHVECLAGPAQAGPDGAHARHGGSHRASSDGKSGAATPTALPAAPASTPLPSLAAALAATLAAR